MSSLKQLKHHFKNIWEQIHRGSISKDEFINKLSNQYYKLEQKAKHKDLDPLTQLFNRHYFDISFKTIFYTLKRESVPLSVLFLDADFFKKVNDTYGHQIGDKVLQKIAQVIKNSTNRRSDLYVRYGGDEFVIILPYTDINGALKVAQKIQKEYKKIQNQKSFPKLKTIQTISIGLATRKNDDTPKSLLKKADEAMYQAKAQRYHDEKLLEENKISRNAIKSRIAMTVGSNTRPLD